MARIAAEAITRAREDYPSMSPERALEFLNDCVRDLASYGQFQEGSADISTLAAGTRTYALSTSAIMGNIRRVTYHTSSTDRKELLQVSQDWLDKNVPNWRELTASTDRGTPGYCYVFVSSDGLRYIGLHPIPDTSVSSGYPKVTLYGPVFGEVTADDSLPDAFPSLEFLRCGMNKLWARGQDVEKYPYWEQLYYQERTAAAIQVKNFLGRHKSSLEPKHVENARVV